MGFKRTPEGRVFFQGGQPGTANDEMLRPRNQAQGLNAPHADNTQAQIIALLKTLNERLKLTQADRQRMSKELEAYRALVQDLEIKTERSARAYTELEKKVAQGQKGSDDSKAESLAREALSELELTRKLLLELEDKADRADQGVSLLKDEIKEARQAKTQLMTKQAALEKLSRDQSEKLSVNAQSYKDLVKRMADSEEKQTALTQRIEQTSLEQERLIRKMDKAIEDRARFMRKIERIEETVLQTRDALNAKAMVLLTDQNKGKAPGVSMADFEEGEEAGLAALRASQAAQIRQETYEPQEWWRKPYKLQAAGVAVLVVASLLGGWAISNSQMPSFPDIEPSYGDVISTSESAQSETIAENESAPVSMAAMDWAVETDVSDYAEAPATTETPDEVVASEGLNEQAAETDAPSDIYAQDDIGMEALINAADVERLLNDSTATAESEDEIAAALNALEPSKATAETAATAQDVEDETLNVAPVDLQNPADLIEPDMNLPEVVKQIETQAFAGVPEAQHDLAAIYTAGHGGVAQNYDRAAFWFEQSAQRGVANAAYNLGVLHHQGLGHAADINEALNWYRKAASLGHPEAQYNLGIAHIEGIGVSYDPQKAANYFRSAADQGVMEAAYNLGLIYENGLLGSPKPDEALMWYKIASDAGSPEAKQALEQLAKALDIDLKDVNKLAESMKAIKKSDAMDTTAAAIPAKKKTQ